ncbi:MAG: hypothetical protein R3D66_05425 [Alphaproteobacteria bacterium]
MRHFTATFTAKDTSKNVQDFIKAHKTEFWDLIKSFAPYIVILGILSVAFQHFAQNAILAEMGNFRQMLENKPGNAAAHLQMMEAMRGSVFKSPYMWAAWGVQLVLGYVFAAIAISWHRLVLLGPEQYRPMNLFKPQRHEIEFVMILALIGVLIPTVFGWIMISGPFFSSSGIWLIGLFSIALIYVSYKICFVFPAKAVNADMDFKTSFKLTKGYFWKFFLAAFRASLKTIGLLFLYQIIVGMAIGTVLAVSGDPRATTLPALIGGGALALPVLLYFQPLLTIIGVTVLSNYYQHALQNKPVSEAAA